LTGAGIVGKTVAYRWILKMERAGRLVIPRDPVTGWRKVTQRQAEEIVRAFSPHGSGYWKNGKKDEKI
jgi:hypothetical protein